MSSSIGKNFEERFKIDWQDSFPQGTIDRLYDSMSGYLSISTVSDFICYNYPNIYYIECKTHKGASLPFTNITQYVKINTKVGIKGVRAGIVLWLYEKDRVFYIPVSTIQKMKKDGEKSVGIRSLSKYDIIEIPSKKLKTYMKSDYSILADLEEGK
jgi:hypothetical protein